MSPVVATLKKLKERVKLIFIFYLMNISKVLAFQYVSNIKIIELFYIFS